MTNAQKNLLSKALKAFESRRSISLLESEKKDAEFLVKKEKCFWSVDRDHIMCYDPRLQPEPCQISQPESSEED